MSSNKSTTAANPTADELIAALPRYHDILTRVLCARYIFDQDAQDLRQQTFLKVIEKIRSTGLREPSKLADYLKGTARHLATAYWRRRRLAAVRYVEPAVLRVDEDDEAEDGLLNLPGHDTDSPVQAAERAETGRRVRSALSRLPLPRDREVLVRAYMNDEPSRPMSEAMQMGEKQFNTVVWRAKARFLKVLDCAL